MKNRERNGNPSLNRKLRFHPFYRSLVGNEVLRQSLTDCYNFFILLFKSQDALGNWSLKAD